MFVRLKVVECNESSVMVNNILKVTVWWLDGFDYCGDGVSLLTKEF